MRPGDLREYITIQSSTESKSATGQLVRSWTTFAQVWANVEVSSATQQDQPDKLSTYRNYTITVRYRNDLRTKWRVLFPDNSIAEIEGFYDQDGKRRWTTITAREVRP